MTEFRPADKVSIWKCWVSFPTLSWIHVSNKNKHAHQQKKSSPAYYFCTDRFYIQTTHFYIETPKSLLTESLTNHYFSHFQSSYQFLATSVTIMSHHVKTASHLPTSDSSIPPPNTPSLSYVKHSQLEWDMKNSWQCRMLCTNHAVNNMLHPYIHIQYSCFAT